MANTLLRVDVTQIIAQRRLGRLQFDIVALCMLAMFVDGYDTQAIGYAAPGIARALTLPIGALTRFLALGGIGSLLGIFILGPWGDRIGRKKVLMGSLLLIAVGSFATAFIISPQQVAVLRFVTGLGLGGLLPSALALAAEFAPRKHKVTLTAVVWFGFASGSLLAGPISDSIGTRYGWEAIFLFGGLLPLVSAPVLWTWLPESLSVLLRRGEQSVPEIRATLIRVSKRYDFLRTTEYFSSEPEERGFPLLRLFDKARAPMTVLLWVAFVMNLTAVFLLNAALPLVFTNAGLSDETMRVVGAVAQFGGIVGGLVVASYADRLNRYEVLAAAFLLSALSIAALGPVGNLTSFAVFGVIAAVFLTMGAQNAAIGVVASSYPTAILATGIGWALGVGHLGQNIAPFVGEMLLSLQWQANHILVLCAVPGLVAAAATFLIAGPQQRLGLATPSRAKTVERVAPSFREVGYPRHTARRLEHLASLGLDLHGKRVLEVHAGAGDHTGFFLDRDCTVLSTEPRDENCQLFAEMLKEYRASGPAKTAICTLVTADLEDIDRRITETFDVVFCYGLLDRVGDPEAALAILAKRCGGLFLLEAGVTFGDNEAINPVAEDQTCRPTRAWLFNRLRSLYPHVYVPRTQPADEEFPLDWSGAPPATGLTRAVFVAARARIVNPLLLDELPARQERS